MTEISQNILLQTLEYILNGITRGFQSFKESICFGVLYPSKNNYFSLTN